MATSEATARAILGAKVRDKLKVEFTEKKTKLKILLAGFKKYGNPGLVKIGETLKTCLSYEAEFLVYADFLKNTKPEKRKEILKEATAKLDAFKTLDRRTIALIRSKIGRWAVFRGKLSKISSLRIKDFLDRYEAVSLKYNKEYDKLLKYNYEYSELSKAA